MLKDTLLKDQIVALKSGDKQKLSVLRYIVAQLKNKEIDKRAPLTDEEVVAVLRKHLKQLQESIDAYKKGNREDLAQDSQAQLDIVSSYLPPELTDEELGAEVERIIQENKEAAGKNPNAIIGICMKLLRGKADPARIMKILKQRT